VPIVGYVMEFGRVTAVLPDVENVRDLRLYFRGVTFTGLGRYRSSPPTYYLTYKSPYYGEDSPIRRYIVFWRKVR
jgi:hypothetical protein